MTSGSQWPPPDQAGLHSLVLQLPNLPSFCLKDFPLRPKEARLTSFQGEGPRCLSPATCAVLGAGRALQVGEATPGLPARWPPAKGRREPCGQLRPGQRQARWKLERAGKGQRRVFSGEEGRKSEMEIRERKKNKFNRGEGTTDKEEGKGK